MSHEYCQPGGVEAHPQLSLISYYIAVMGEDEAYNRYNSISDVSLKTFIKFEINVHRLSFFSRSFIFVFFSYAIVVDYCCLNGSYITRLDMSIV